MNLMSDAIKHADVTADIDTLNADPVYGVKWQLQGKFNGEIKILINQGTVSKLLLEEMGLNIGSVILTRLVSDKQVKLNCMATDFGVTNGLMQTRRFIIDTDDAIIDVSGNIILAQE